MTKKQDYNFINIITIELDELVDSVTSETTGILLQSYASIPFSDASDDFCPGSPGDGGGAC